MSEQPNGLTADPEMVALSDKYTDMRMLDHDDLSDYVYEGSSFKLLKEYGADTNAPRFMIGKLSSDVLAKAVQDRDADRLAYREQTRELRDAVRDRDRDKRYRVATDIDFSEALNTVSSLRNELSNLRGRTTEFEGHLGILRDEVGLERCVELLGK